MQKVEVTAQPQQFFNSIDRKVYLVGKDVVSTTGSAGDLLQNVPALQVDVDGNVSLRGDTGVEILINGKPSAMMGRNRAAAAFTLRPPQYCGGNFSVTCSFSCRFGHQARARPLTYRALSARPMTVHYPL